MVCFMFPSAYFKRQEFSCKCGCGYDTVDSELLEILNELRFSFHSPVYINSGCRCKEHNRLVGGKKNSFHLVGKAADIRVEGILPESVYYYLSHKYPDKYGIGKYDSFTHVDVRSVKRRF